MYEIARAVDALAEFETRHAARRERTLIVQSGSELAEKLLTLPSAWLIESVSRQQNRFVVRLATFDFMT